jgi:hypothetical protein
MSEDNGRPDWLDEYAKQLKEMLGGREPCAATLERVRRCHHFLCRMSVTKIPMVQLAGLAAVDEEISPAATPCIPLHVQDAHEQTQRPKKPPTPRAESKRLPKEEIACPFTEGQKVVSNAASVPLGGVFQKQLPNGKGLVRVNDRDMPMPLESLSAVNG